MSLYEKASMIARQFAYVLIITNTVEQGTIVLDVRENAVYIHKSDSGRG